MAEDGPAGGGGDNKDSPPPPRKKSETRQRQKQFKIRCTLDEFNTIAAKANQAGFTPPAYIRAAVLGDAGPRAQRRLPADAQALKKVRLQIGGEDAAVGCRERLEKPGTRPDHALALRAEVCGDSVGIGERREIEPLADELKLGL